MRAEEIFEARCLVSALQTAIWQSPDGLSEIYVYSDEKLSASLPVEDLQKCVDQITKALDGLEELT